MLRNFYFDVFFLKLILSKENISESENIFDLQLQLILTRVCILAKSPLFFLFIMFIRLNCETLLVTKTRRNSV